MNKVLLAIGIHNHQPVGNFDFVFEDSYQKSYLPFLETLERHPRVRLAMHYSGILLEWILQHHPEYVGRLKALVRSGRVEMITGGYYEPILSAIPEPDRQGQIEKLTAFIRRQTGDAPEGMWCAERVWEPHLPKTMAAAGVRYSILDDAHFKYAGFEEHELQGYFVTEEMGETVSLFPISERLRYAIPFKPPQATIDILREAASQGEGRLAVFADDGEKFGVWPETYDHVYTQGWLESFFRALDEASDWVEMVHFREALRRVEPLGRVYIPTASYREMMHWALRTAGYRDYEDFENRLKTAGLFERYHIFVRGGFWRNFLTKYPESNTLHKKMLHASRKVWDAKRKMTAGQFRRTLDHLWAGQCNCPYWHGVFGGLYLPHLRHANFGHLITAERLADEAAHPGKAWIDATERDFDGDGQAEVLVSNRKLGLAVHREGGRLIEFDDRIRAVNLLNVMGRREEGYHHALLNRHKPKAAAVEGEVASIHDRVTAKEEGLEKLLVTDWHPRAGFLDHFLDPSASFDAFADKGLGEAGNFVNGKYAVGRKCGKLGATVECVRDGNVWIGGAHTALRVRKTYSVKPDRAAVAVDYSVETDAGLPGPLWFGVENAFAFTSPNDPECTVDIDGNPADPLFVNGRGASAQIREIALSDRRMGFTVRLVSDRSADLWRFPIETVSMSEAGFERVYQGTVALLHWRIHPKPGEPFRVRIVESVGGA
jgi:4-alpha-glucanotransferase